LFGASFYPVPHMNSPVFPPPHSWHQHHITLITLLLVGMHTLPYPHHHYLFSSFYPIFPHWLWYFPSPEIPGIIPLYLLEAIIQRVQPRRKKKNILEAGGMLLVGWKKKQQQLKRQPRKINHFFCFCCWFMRLFDVPHSKGLSPLLSINVSLVLGTLKK